MVKGENLEKPKKGGMVIVIGVGKPPKKKKGDLKKSGPRRISGSERTKRATRDLFEQQLDRNPNLIDDRLEQMGVEKDFMEQYMQHHHDMSIDEAAKKDNIDIMAEMRQARRTKAGLDGNFDNKGRPKPRLKRLLEMRRIPISTFKRSIKESPFIDFEERMNELGASSSRRRSRERKRIRRENPSPQDRKNPVLDDPDDILFQGKPAGGRRMVPMFDRMGRKSGERAAAVEPQPDSAEEDELLDFYQRLFSHRRDPVGAALQMLGRGESDDPNLEEQRFQQRESEGPDTTPSTVFTQRNVPPGFRAGSPDEDEDPMVGFDAASIGATTPKSQTANPRDLGPLMRPREGQGEERIIRPFRMQTSFDDPKSVMDEAWALLKANPEMQAQDGTTMHPSAKIYAEMAAGKQAEEEQGVHRSPEHRRNLARHITTHRMNKPSVLGREAYIGDEHDEQFHNPAQRVLRPEEEEGGYVEQRDSALRP